MKAKAFFDSPSIITTTSPPSPVVARCYLLFPATHRSSQRQLPRHEEQTRRITNNHHRAPSRETSRLTAFQPPTRPTNTNKHGHGRQGDRAAGKRHRQSRPGERIQRRRHQAAERAEERRPRDRGCVALHQNRRDHQPPALTQGPRSRQARHRTGVQVEGGGQEAAQEGRASTGRRGHEWQRVACAYIFCSRLACPQPEQEQTHRGPCQAQPQDR